MVVFIASGDGVKSPAILAFWRTSTSWCRLKKIATGKEEKREPIRAGTEAETGAARDRVQGPGSLDMRGWTASAGIRPTSILRVFWGHVWRVKTVSECAKAEYFYKNASAGQNVALTLFSM